MNTTQYKTGSLSTSLDAIKNKLSAIEFEAQSFDLVRNIDFSNESLQKMVRQSFPEFQSLQSKKSILAPQQPVFSEEVKAKKETTYIVHQVSLVKEKKSENFIKRLFSSKQHLSPQLSL
jgi:hypothetical protein